MSEHEREARNKRLAELRAAGIDPYPARVPGYERLGAIVEQYGDSSAESLEAEPVTRAVAGRVLASRSFGKLLFLRLLENGVTLQLSGRKSEVDEATFRFLRSLDVGDFIWAEGPLWRTKTDELTVDVHRVQMLAKALRPLPEKWHGLTDVETRYRQRYLDLLVNEDSRRVAVLRSRIVTAIRAFLDEREFLEVETPVLQPLYGGALARPFTTHHNLLDQDLYLRVSDELYLKRLVVGGLDRVYEIGRDFRNEGISKKHNPEFSMLECYQAYADYQDMMKLLQELLQSVSTRVFSSTQRTFRGQEIELSGHWPRITLGDAIRKATGVDVMAAADVGALREAVKAAGLPSVDSPTWGTLVDELFSRHVEPELIQPTFITGYPVELSPLAKRSPENPRLVERFELFMGGFEIANAFSELNDPEDQRARFEEQRRARESGDEDAHPLDEDYLRALEHGLPPTGGLGMGIGRLTMVLTDVASIRETKLFPHLRPDRG